MTEKPEIKEATKEEIQEFIESLDKTPTE